jgi:THO complex subunit 3
MVYDINQIENDPISVIEVSNSSLNSVKIDNLNKTFCTGGDDGLITLWNLEDLMSYKIIKKSDLEVKKIGFSHDSKLISAIYEGQNLDIFDISTKTCVYSIYSENQFYSICWNPVNYTLAFSGIDKLKTGQEEGGINILTF